MRILVESLKRMYNSTPRKITKEKIENFSILTKEEKDYILN
jgi:hypothetical protein